MAQQNPVLPADPALKTGKLDNGLTYYIRPNKMDINIFLLLLTLQN